MTKFKIVLLAAEKKFAPDNVDKHKQKKLATVATFPSELGVNGTWTEFTFAACEADSAESQKSAGEDLYTENRE